MQVARDLSGTIFLIFKKFQLVKLVSSALQMDPAVGGPCYLIDGHEIFMKWGKEALYYQMRYLSDKRVADE